MPSVRYSRAIIGALHSLEDAKKEAAKIKCAHVEVVAVFIRSAQMPVGYLIVPTEHDCPACGQPVTEPIASLFDVAS
jgi:hypothetical protein